MLETTSEKNSTDNMDEMKPNAESEGELYRQLKYWQCLRQDLERARLLCELVRKREKLKKELCKVKELWMEVHLQPLVCFLRRLLDMIQSRDTGDIFSEPVDLSEVPDYSDVVTQPMDISTMRTKLENFQYSNLDAFEKDFNLMINNCMAYNSRDTIFYRAAVKMRDQGGALIRQARRDLEANGFDMTTGLLLPDGTSSSQQSSNSLPESKSSRIPTTQVQQSSQQSSQSTPSQQQHSQQQQQPEEGLAGEIDRELAAVTDKSRSMAEDGFESDSEREDSSDEEVEKRQQRSAAKPIARHSTRRSSQHQQVNEEKGKVFYTFFYSETKYST
ncbi:hypothetical protein ANN_07090 [Periplaneta americana]|uniref:Bromo domain-containing protein n=1 Tax=Periplaneta americana TaxID=6978 RepID=A0ABQ8TFA1_PERAM|nr:hypothetical protein ANN_07090 [Periplaneta americana]